MKPIALSTCAAALLAAGSLTLSAHAATAAASPPAASAPATAAAAGDIYDIRPPIHLPAPFSVAALDGRRRRRGALGYGAWKLACRPRPQQPWELALEKLQATRPLMEEENAQPFSLAVSEIVRGFIEQSFPLRAAHRTTEEFLRDVADMEESPLAAHREALREFLQHCDLAKFARWSLTREQMEAMLASASTFVTAIGKPPSPVKKAAPTAAQPAPVLASAHS